MLKKTILTFIFVIAVPVISFAENLTVAVAANVQYTFEELAAAFEEDTGISIRPVIGSSGKLTTQMENGAPFDVFLSADTDYPDALYREGLTHNQPEIYAYGTLVLWTLNEIDLTRGLQALADPSVRKIALPTPKTAPYGRQAVNALKHAGIYTEVSKKLVYGESIAQANQFITSRASDVGLTAKSIVLAPNMKNEGKWVEVDKEAYEPIAQAAVILKFAEKGNLDAAQKFYAFLFSRKAGDIFEKYGYILPEKEK